MSRIKAHRQTLYYFVYNDNITLQYPILEATDIFYMVQFHV